MTNYLSPTGAEIIGTAESVPAVAVISSIGADGTPIYEGRTDLFWDAQVTHRREGKILFLDYEGDMWTFDQLVPEEQSDASE
jgi:hypothetical protein